MEQSANFPSFLPAKNLTDKWEETYHADVDLVKNTMAEITDAELNNPDYVAMFGQRLKAERKSKNITLDQEADQLGINRTTILDMENNPNRKKVNREYLYAVSLFFQNSPCKAGSHCDKRSRKHRFHAPHRQWKEQTGSGVSACRSSHFCNQEFQTDSTLQIRLTFHRLIQIKPAFFQIPDPFRLRDTGYKFAPGKRFQLLV